MSDDTPEELMRVGRLAEMGLLSASLMHELRQPLLAIQATAEMAVAGGSPDAERWRRVLTQLHHVRALLDDYSGLAREDGTVVRLDVRRPVRAAVATLRSRARQARVEVVVDLPDRAVWIRARESALRQIVVNLVHNGIDASEGGAEARVVITLTAEGPVTRLLVDDGGAGPGPDPESLFGPFVTSKEEGRGTGLGLFIARTLARDAGGDVSLAPRGGGGTRATVTVPSAKS